MSGLMMYCTTHRGRYLGETYGREREREERRERGEREKGIDEITGEITMEEETLEWNAHIISMEYPL